MAEKWTIEAIRQRLMDNFERDPVTDCWIWQGAIATNGYGRITIDGRSYEVHRIAYNAFKEPFNCWLNICHKCDNPPCINPDHLFTGCRRENMEDMRGKGRHRSLYGEGHQSAKLTNKDVSDIRLLTETMTQREIALHYGICQPHVSDILNGKKRQRG